MSRFNLYFAGAAPISDPTVRQKLEQRECYILSSWFNERKHSIKMITRDHKIFLDSGAFSAHTLGVEPDVDGYIDFCNAYDSGIRIFAEMDKIPGEFRKPKTRAQLEEAPEISWKNYLYMRERLVSPDKCMPIFHQGEDFKHLIRILESEFDGRGIPYMGVSPANDVNQSQKNAWIYEVFDIIKKSSNPSIDTHAYGMTSIDALNKFPFTSADSTTWILTAAQGGILTDYGSIFISEKASPAKSIDYLPKYEKDTLVEMIEASDYDYHDLATIHAERVKWNIDYLCDWRDNYSITPLVKPNPLFSVKR